eukprot:Gb_05343 [translate_table: standard]
MKENGPKDYDREIDKEAEKEIIDREGEEEVEDENFETKGKNPKRFIKSVPKRRVNEENAEKKEVTTKAHSEWVEGEFSITTNSLFLGSLAKGQIGNEKMDQEATIGTSKFLPCTNKETMDKVDDYGDEVKEEPIIKVYNICADEASTLALKEIDSNFVAEISNTFANANCPKLDYYMNKEKLEKELNFFQEIRHAQVTDKEEKMGSRETITEEAKLQEARRSLEDFGIQRLKGSPPLLVIKGILQSIPFPSQNDPSKDYTGLLQILAGSMDTDAPMKSFRIKDENPVGLWKYEESLDAQCGTCENHSVNLYTDCQVEKQSDADVSQLAFAEGKYNHIYHCKNQLGKTTLVIDHVLFLTLQNIVLIIITWFFDEEIGRRRHTVEKKPKRSLFGDEEPPSNLHLGYVVHPKAMSSTFESSVWVTMIHKRSSSTTTGATGAL